MTATTATTAPGLTDSTAGCERATGAAVPELGIADGTVVLLYSGSMNKKQGLGLLVEAIQQLTDLPNLVWLLAGEGPSKGELAAATAGMANVTLLPLQPAERLNDWLNLADVHLLGILASGRPVVASSPAASELGHLAEQAGLRVEPEDGAGFAAAVRQLVQAPALRSALGAQARQLVEERYGQEAVLGELEAQLAKASAIQQHGTQPWLAG